MAGYGFVAREVIQMGITTALPRSHHELSINKRTKNHQLVP